jgi:hypothetical protein
MRRFSFWGLLRVKWCEQSWGTSPPEHINLVQDEANFARTLALWSFIGNVSNRLHREYNKSLFSSTIYLKARFALNKVQLIIYGQSPKVWDAGVSENNLIEMKKPLLFVFVWKKLLSMWLMVDLGQFQIFQNVADDFN